MAGLQDTMIKELYTLEETIARDIFEDVTYPWEVLAKIKDFIVALGETLPEEKFEIRDAKYIRNSEEPLLIACS